MKYFTKEELEDITKNLLEDPSRETLKRLNEKYNGSVEASDPPVDKLPNVSVEPPVVAPISVGAPGNQSPVEPAPKKEAPKPVNPIPNYNIPTMEVPKTENSNNNIGGIPSFELPKLETPVFNNQNNQPVNFSGNIFEQRQDGVNNLMQTTDNFGKVRGTNPNTEVPVNGSPFFGPSTDNVNNPIPVGGSMPGPTMFGQFEQNYM